ncbi:hypothetical protein SK128_026696 [Halocaridina rubra]|uniref:Uncharacterized protein n=1 Tax=Halocaridina rubra TaxID=373956 RepID=A0AAN9A4Q0_HALRR
MPRYAYQKPRAKVYAYNFGYMSNYYKPMTHYLNKETHHPSERPGAQSLAEVEIPLESPAPRSSWPLHPYRLPIEDERYGLDEEALWPSTIPHFNLVSSYDCMCKLLGI